MVVGTERFAHPLHKSRLASPKLSPERNDISALKVPGERVRQLKSFLL